MSFNYFTFNGQRLEDFGFIVKKKPQYIIAEKDYTSEGIAGKDGNIIAYNGRYKNRTATYTIISLPTRVHCSNRELVNKLNYWLNAATKYCKFTDTFNQGLYTEGSMQQQGIVNLPIPLIKDCTQRLFAQKLQMCKTIWMELLKPR